MNSASLVETAACCLRRALRCRKVSTSTSARRASPTSSRSTSLTSASAAFSSMAEMFFSSWRRLVMGKRWERAISREPSRVPFLAKPPSSSGLLRRPACCMRPMASWMRRRAAARCGLSRRTRWGMLSKVTIRPEEARAVTRPETVRATAVMVRRKSLFMRRKVEMEMEELPEGVPKMMG